MATVPRREAGVVAVNGEGTTDNGLNALPARPRPEADANQSTNHGPGPQTAAAQNVTATTRIWMKREC